MNQTRIALYIGNELYPTATFDPAENIAQLQGSPLTSAILSLLNNFESAPTILYYNDNTNPVFDNTGAYIGTDQWPQVIADLRGGNIQEVYLSFSTSGTEFMANLLEQDPSAANQILTAIKGSLGFDGIDLDYEGPDFSTSSPIYPVAKAAIAAGLKLTAAPFSNQGQWETWVKFVQSQQGTVSWLNLQCYAGGKFNNPGEWLSAGVPIVAGSCPNCCCAQTTCSPSDMQALFTLWRTGKGSVTQECWSGERNRQPQAIGGGFIWAYGSIINQFTEYMDAVATGLGISTATA